MKTVSAPLLAYLNAEIAAAAPVAFGCDLFTLMLAAGSVGGVADGTVIAVAGGDYPVAWNAHTYLANSLMIEGLKYKATTGVNADTQQIVITATPAMTIGGVPFLQTVLNKLLDGALVQRERAYFSSLAPPFPLAPIGTILLFKGRVTEVNSVGRTQAKVTVASDLTLLDIDMPRRVYQTSCNHVLYDSGCGLSRATYTATGAVGGGSTASVIAWGSATSAYEQGAIVFTSGANTGVRATIKHAATGSLTLAYPLPSVPAAGDAFQASQGCDHTMTTCNSKFGNLANYFGFPFVPPPQIITGPLASTANGGKG